MTVEDAIQRTGARNVIMAGGLPLDRSSLDAMPSARRIICKSGIHAFADGKAIMDRDEFLGNLRAAKEFAASDERIEAFHVDDFSGTSIDAGVTSEHVTQLQFANVVERPQLPLGVTNYTAHLERPELPPPLQYFAYMLVPLWHADQIDTVPEALNRLSNMSGGKPMILCLYVRDFGNAKPIPHQLMQRHLDLAERLVRQERVTGLCICGTCMMDLDWESNRCFYEWLDRVGDTTI
ncbi:MAG: hypothetical protein QGH74_00535 [Candidatus Brocadiia bacterium]|nr:hypothetical protein [Candidatus Brocadiia bacterium]